MNPGTVTIKAASRSAEITFSIDLAWQDKTARPSLPSATRPVTTPSTVTTPVVTAAVNSLLAQRKQNFPLTTPNAITKISNTVSSSMAPVLMKRDVAVLLHNASMLSSSWTFVCSGTCSMSDVPFTSITVTSRDGMLTVQKNGLTRKEEMISMQASANSTITVTDAVSKKQYGIYRGKMTLVKQNIKKIDGAYVNQYAVINTLPLEQYLAGIAEASDREPIEKTKVLALLAKAYALYYVG